LDEVRKNVPSQTCGNYISMFNTAVVDLETGSDHLILSDPAINIPSVMLGQWPDFNYHTSGDTMEVIDPFILHKSASICAGFIYTLANLSLADVALVMNKSRERFVGDLAKLVHSAVEQETQPGLVFEKFNHSTDFYKACNVTFPHFFSGPEQSAVSGQVEQENAFLDSLSTAMWDRYRQDYAPGFAYAPAEVPAMYRYIPLRTFAAPLAHVDDYALGDEHKLAAYKGFQKEWALKVFNPHYLDSTVQFYIDGKRSLWEIARQAMLETRDGSVEYVHHYVQMLLTLDLVEVHG
jgi:hypothetical protein